MTSAVGLTRICPVSGEPVEAIILTWPNNNTGLVVICDKASRLGRCPLGKERICVFYLNSEKRWAVGHQPKVRSSPEKAKTCA